MRRGSRVAGTVRKLADATELKHKFPDQLWVGELDLSDLANIPKVFSAAVEQRGRVHAVVNNAAYILMGAAEELELDAIRHNCGYQLIGSIQLARAAVAHMRPLGGGRILQIQTAPASQPSQESRFTALRNGVSRDSLRLFRRRFPVSALVQRW
jgi:NAD(P)-dependent dehydrogenase (short-subunit alcohol dehydrogenase family)